MDADAPLLLTFRDHHLLYIENGIIMVLLPVELGVTDYLSRISHSCNILLSLSHDLMPCFKRTNS